MSSLQQDYLRQLPSVHALLQTDIAHGLSVVFGDRLTVDAIRHVLAYARQAILAEEIVEPVTVEQLLQQAHDELDSLLAPTLHPLINATGIIVHTNLGRAPLSEATVQAITAVAQQYSTLEYNTQTGGRGSRSLHANNLLVHLTKAESAFAVNNAASAVLLMLTALCKGQEVIISRSQLVEIGGGFRIPDVMAQSGAKLVEVGTTNRTHLRDYANAITENTGAIMVAHYSNYRIIGFTTEPSLPELANLAHTHNIPLLYDQGSGALLDVAQFGLRREPTVIDAVIAEADIIAFSGDKLLGGPQAGLLCGRTDLIQTLKKHPLARAIRADKLCLAGLTATLTHYLKGEALEKVPIWQMMARSLADIEADAQAWAMQWRSQGINARVIDGQSAVGGGSLPGTTLPSKVVALQTKNPTALAARLRKNGVIARLKDGRLLLDPRTILPNQVDELLTAVVNSAL